MSGDPGHGGGEHSQDQEEDVHDGVEVGFTTSSIKFIYSTAASKC